MVLMGTRCFFYWLFISVPLDSTRFQPVSMDCFDFAQVLQKVFYGLF